MDKIDRFIVKLIERIEVDLFFLKGRFLFRIHKRKAIGYLAAKLTEDEWSRDRFSTIVDKTYENVRRKG